MFSISYHPKVSQDLAKLSSSNKKQIRKAIEEKLTINPVFYGKPLQFSLAGLRSMRVGDYRVIFRIKGVDVFVELVSHRSVVYKEATSRIS
jgi:mRNA interferase RelE/StbE